MKKRCLKLFICFLATISVFLFNNSVKADETIDINVNGKPGVGGQDPCDKFSYVCIYNYAAFKVTHYKASSAKKTKIYYTSGYSKNPFRSKSVNETNSRFDAKITYETINFKSYNLGNVSKKFTSTSGQKVYKKIIQQLKKKNSKLTRKIMIDFGITDSYIKSNQKDYFFVEPLFYMKMQDAGTVQRLHKRTTNKPNFRYYYGTAYGIAEKVSSQYDKCKSQIPNDAECYKAYISRKEKGHVGRMGNSMRTTKKVTVGGFTLNKAGLVVKGKTKMKDLADKNKGYGVASIRFNVYIDVPDSETPEKMCYSYEEKNFDPSCTKSAENFQKKVGTITADQNGSQASNCVDGTKKDGNKYNSQSKYGKKMKTIGGQKAGDYCALYCTKENYFYTEFEEIKGAKEISAIPSLKSSSIEYSQSFKIKKEESYECHVDLKKYYGDYNVPDEWVDTLPDGNVAQAAYKISQANDNLTTELDHIDMNKTLSEEAKQAKKEAARRDFASIGNQIVEELNHCLFTPITEGDFKDEKFSNDNIKVYVDGEAKDVEPVTIIEGEIKNDTTNLKLASLGQIPKLSDVENHGGYYMEYIQKQIKKMSQRKEITYEKELEYKLNSTTKYGLDLKGTRSTDEDKGYADVDDDVTDNSLCDVKEKLLKSNKTKNESTVTIFDGNDKNNNDKYVCEKIEYSNNITATCPANTYHAGTNAYYWLAYDELKDDEMKYDAMNGIDKADAISKYCNDTSLPKFSGGYEPIIDEGKVIDDCLMAGYSIGTCKEKDEDRYYCTDGKGITTDVSYWVYLEANKQKIEDKDIDKSKLQAVLAKVKKTNPACTNACYEKNKPKGFVYRSILLGSQTEAFPGKSGNGRTPGANWNSDSTIKTAITNTKTVYNGEPMYTIILNYKTIKNIRNNLNSKYSYDYIGNRLRCNANNAACLDAMVHADPVLYGFQKSKCKSVGFDDFYSSSCVNYNIGGK